MRRRLAVWLLTVADRVEAAAYRVDDRAWAQPAFGTQVAFPFTLTNPLPHGPDGDTL